MLRSNQLGKEGHPFLRILFGNGQHRGDVHDLHQQDEKALQGLHGNIGGGGGVAGYSEVVVVVVVLVVGCVWLSLLPIFIIGNGDRCRTLAQGSSI